MEANLVFGGFLVFHCPLKPDAIEMVKMIGDSSHRVGLVLLFLVVRFHTEISSAQVIIL